MFIELGKHLLNEGATLAPMAGITNPPFRQLCKEMGASLCVTELISSHAVVYLKSKAKNRGKKLGLKVLSLMEKYSGEYPYVVQIYGRDPSIMAEAAKIVEDEGADIIDLNFGCPARKVIKNGMGSGVALMLDPSLLGLIASAVVSAVSVPVIAKTRLGYSKEHKNGVEIARILEQSGVKLLTIHARTREQGHSGCVDLDTLGQIVNAVTIPVVGNGGIKSYSDAAEMMKYTGCKTVAVGQGAKGNPWIFEEIKNNSSFVKRPSLEERIKVCRRHLNLYVNWVDEQRAVLEMRKHACWYLKGFDGAAAFRKRLGEATSIETFNVLLNELL
jgi:nifR3 family TIM-barrel protein